MRTATRRATIYGGRRGVAAADWWPVAGQTCVGAYKPIGAADLATSYINLANPGTYNAALGVAPTLGAAGWVFDGIDDYLTTGLTITAVGVWTMLVRYSDASGDNCYMAGAGQTPDERFYLAARTTMSSVARREYGFSSGVSDVGFLKKEPNVNTGVMAIAGFAAYIDGAADGNVSGGAAYPGNPIWFGGVSGFPVYGAVTIAAAAIYKPTEPSTTPMSASDVAALTARMAALA